MSHPYYHSLSSQKKFGGKPEDYQPIHDWFDETKKYFADVRHRSIRHHSAGIFWCEEKFGTTIKNSDGKIIPVRLIAEQHVIEDMGRIPSLSEFLSCMQPQSWMSRNTKEIEKEFFPST